MNTNRILLPLLIFALTALSFTAAQAQTTADEHSIEKQTAGAQIGILDVLAQFKIVKGTFIGKANAVIAGSTIRASCIKVKLLN